MEEEKRERGRQENQKMKAYLVMRLLQKESEFDAKCVGAEISPLRTRFRSAQNLTFHTKRLDTSSRKTPK